METVRGGTRKISVVGCAGNKTRYGKLAGKTGCVSLKNKIYIRTQINMKYWYLAGKRQTV